MFTRLTAPDIGLTAVNAYDDPEMWGSRYMEFTLGSMGTGVAAGDFDRDGRCDLAVVTKTKGCRLYRNLGGWRFEDVTDPSGVAVSGTAVEWLQGVTFADVDNDGWLDLYVCRFAAPNQLFMNQRDGRFREEAAARGVAIRDASGMAAFCDYDRDGWLDVYLQTNLLDARRHPTGQKDYLLRNRGDGRFTDVTAEAGIAGETLAHSSTWWDYDADGWPDLYVANDFSGPDRLYRNLGNGSFANVVDTALPYTAYSSMGADVGDVNNDGFLDLLVGDMAATTHEKDQRGMATARDQHRDERGPVAPQYPRNMLYLGSSTGRLIEAGYLARVVATDWTWSMRFEDLDNDGWVDLHVTNGMNREYHNADLRERLLHAPDAVERMRVVRTSPPLRERHLALRNTGDLHFEDASARWGLDEIGISFGAAFADFDGDGDQDLVYSNYDAPVSVYRNDCVSGGRLVVALQGRRSNRDGVGATVRVETARGTQTRTLTLARGYLSCSEPVLHFGLGDAERVNRVTVTWPSGATQVVDGVEVDRKLTLLEPEVADSTRAPVRAPNSQFEEISSALGLSLTARDAASEAARPQPMVPWRLENGGPALLAADFGSGDELVLGATRAEPARRVRRAGDGRFEVLLQTEEGSGAAAVGPMLAFDADGDGRADLMAARAGCALPAGSPDYQPRLWLSREGGLVAAPAESLPPVPVSAGALCAADFDRDGRLDVFLGGRVTPGRYPLAPESTLLRNVGGRFEDATAEIAPELRRVGMVTSAVWSDADGDGWVDLVVTLDWGTPRLFINEQGRRLTDRSREFGFTRAGSGWWTSVTATDLNGDERPDFLLGNVGLNTPYQASAERPALLYYGDFGAPGGPLLVEGYWQGDKVYPRRTRKELSQRLPALGPKYRRNDMFARATLQDLLGEERLTKAQKWSADELRSGVLLSAPAGGWEFAPLPRLAQVAPAQGMVASDFNGDGATDVFVAQNSFAPVPSIGRFAGGVSLLLRGDGHGGLAPVAPAESGLVVPGDAEAALTCDLDGDGWRDLLVTRNQATVLAFRNRGNAGGVPTLAIRCKGRAGNPQAIGARLTAVRADGSTRLAELRAGEGYLSQPMAEALFCSPRDNPVREVRVRWPAGQTTVHAVDPARSIIVLESPER